MISLPGWGLIAIVVAIAVALYVWLNLFLVGSPTAPLATVKRFYDAAERGRYDQAYRTLHPTLQTEQSVEQFVILAEANAQLFKATYRKWTTVTSNEEMVIRGEINTRHDEDVLAHFSLVKHGGGWGIWAYQIEGASGNSMGAGKILQDDSSN